MMLALESDQQYVDILSSLTLSREIAPDLVERVARLKEEKREDFLRVAQSHHVVIRGLARLQQLPGVSEHSNLPGQISESIVAEQQRIKSSLSFRDNICSALTKAGFPVVVIKTLEHWPDMGSDLDLYSTADPQAVVRVLTSTLNATVQPRSWGDRLANKWNFALPRLPEFLEIHFKRLGQTGEHTAMAQRFVTRRVFRCVSAYKFPVPAPEECVIVATLQRMYRHFYFRLSDILNTAAQVKAGDLDYHELRRTANLGGIWRGVATYLMIVSDYVQRYTGQALELPSFVTAAAAFGGDKVLVRDCFLRVPTFPDGAKLYTGQVKEITLKGNVPAVLRLGLLPPLASVAAVACRITGSDKGIW